jgi:hypothetical protein
MGFSALTKSKKMLLLGSGAVVVILIGFFLLKFMSSEATDDAPDRSRPSRSAAKKITKPKPEEPQKSPLFETLQSLKDPFRTEDPKLIDLQDRLSVTQKEVEYLKVSLEEKKLRQEIKEIEETLKESDAASLPAMEVKAEPKAGESEQVYSPRTLLVKAILITDDDKSALIVSGNKKCWVREGENFDGWEIKEIKSDSVVALREGKTYVFFYDRTSSVAIEG